MQVIFSSCSKCNDEVIPFEGFDIAVVDDLKQSLIGPDKRYQIEDIVLEVEGVNIIYGNYNKNGIYYFLVDFSTLDGNDVVTELQLSKGYSIPMTFNISKDNTHCFAHNDLNDLVIDGNKYELREQILVFQ